MNKCMWLASGQDRSEEGLNSLKFILICDGWDVLYSSTVVALVFKYLRMPDLKKMYNSERFWNYFYSFLFLFICF